MNYSLRTYDDPILHQQCRIVEEKDRENLPDLLSAMIKAMRLYGGIGIAAPQVGSDLRVIIVGMFSPQSRTIDAVPMVNPTMLAASNPVIAGEEGCLSFPGIKAQVPRHEHVKIAYLDPWTSRRNKYKLHKFAARVFQHELDHLDGVCKVGDEWKRQHMPRVEVAQHSLK